MTSHPAYLKGWTKVVELWGVKPTNATLSPLFKILKASKSPCLLSCHITQPQTLTTKIKANGHDVLKFSSRPPTPGPFMILFLSKISPRRARPFLRWARVIQPQHLQSSILQGFFSLTSEDKCTVSVFTWYCHLLSRSPPCYCSGFFYSRTLSSATIRLSASCNQAPAPIIHWSGLLRLPVRSSWPVPAPFSQASPSVALGTAARFGNAVLSSESLWSGSPGCPHSFLTILSLLPLPTPGALKVSS